MILYFLNEAIIILVFILFSLCAIRFHFIVTILKIEVIGLSKIEDMALQTHPILFHMLKLLFFKYIHSLLKILIAYPGLSFVTRKFKKINFILFFQSNLGSKKA
jgi:hypothetical protein